MAAEDDTSEVETEEPERVEARVSEGPRISAIWFVPIIAVLIGLWMVYTHWARGRSSRSLSRTRKA